MAPGMTEMYPMEIGQAPQVLATDGIFDLVREDLQGVEEAIGFESAASAGVMAALVSKGPRQGSCNRLRAALLLLCARFGGGGNRTAIQLGAVVEMLHSATLIHGGVIDAEQSRRGWPLPVVPYDGRAGVLSGDWLYIRAFRLALAHGVLDQVLGASQRMVLGELMQRRRIGCIAVTEAECLELADCKTAGLFSASGKLGAVAAGLDSTEAEKLAEFAWNLGMAFQLTDDLLDFVVPESTSGYPPGSDLKDGKVTLPLVYALEQASASERTLVAGVLRDRGADAVSFANALALVERHGGGALTRARARQFANDARQILGEFPESLCRRALLALTHLATEPDC